MITLDLAATKSAMRRLIPGSCALVLAGLPAHAEISGVLGRYRDADKEGVLIACHRAGYLNKDGKSGLPENSVPAIRASIEAGAEILEIDLAMSSDGQLVLMHDKTIDRTTTGTGSPSAYTLAALKELSLRDPEGVVTTEKIPTFKETMELVKGRAMVNLDKLDITDRAKMDATLQVLRETGTVDHAIFKGSASPKAVKKALSRFEEPLMYMPIVANTSAEKVVAILDELKPEAIEVVFKASDSPMLAPEVLAAAKRNDTRIWINSLWPSLNGGHHDALAVSGNPDGTWGWILGKGATIIQTDQRDPLLDYLVSKGKRTKAP